jgi:excinuclease ABC subunit C
MIDRIECFDISHTQGEATVASCVVFDQNGPRKSDYRKFKIRDAQPGDDYGAMREAIERRYSRLKREEKNLPDVLLIDGGKGQIGNVKEVFKELQIDEVKILGIAKGATRKPGLETIFLGESGKVVNLPSGSKALRHLQYVRDEAHRFAIEAHRRSRAKTRNRSSLEGIPGIGAKRRKLLIQHFGGIKGVGAASIDDLANVSGVSQDLAKRIHDVMHD